MRVKVLIGWTAGALACAQKRLEGWAFVAQALLPVPLLF
jgi:hypothetical protein